MADTNVRVLGNDVVHDPWREVTDEELEKALEYVWWVIRDFYEARGEVETILRAKGRLPPSTPVAGGPQSTP